MPCGPLIRRMSFSFICENTCSRTGRREPDGYAAEQRVVVRRIGEREAAPAAVLEQDIDVLSGEKLQAFAGGQLQPDDHDVGAARSSDCTAPAAS